MTVAKSCPILLLVGILVVGLIGSAMYSNADSAFDLFNTYGLYKSDGSTPMSAGSLVQLIWTGDFAYHPASQGLLDSAGYLTSGDYILFQGVSPTALAWLGDLDGTVNYDSLDVGGSAMPSGWVYARVFDTNTTPLIQCWFYQTALISVMNEQTNVPADTPDTVDVALGGGTGPGGGSVMDMQVIPEPATMAIFGFGLVSMVMWRLRKR
ncbi:MAG: PEP-CTERM sorting domain-containing protein [Kiritimatiellae bacterium]|nr:PEP-CTERM sorting domain-containing protein [Kiritimatiellia bacterium]